MRIKSLATAKVYDLHIDRSGENRQPCPECSPDRKKKTEKCFSFNAAKGVGFCQHCQANFVEYRQPVEKKTYTIPVWRNKTKLTDKAAEWMRGRCVMDQVLNKMNVSSSTEWMPGAGKEMSVVCFPYYRRGDLVNVKYRDGNKGFKLEKDAELILYNLDAVTGQKEIIIVEGEIDCLSFLQAGILNVVSVPNGAGSTNLEYLDNCFDELAPVERVIIGVDNDTAGYKLREELIRRFGAERCAVMDYGDCKDANEYLQKYGSFQLGDLPKSAKDVPVSGLIHCSDIYDEIYDLYLNGFQKGAELGIPQLDELVTWVTGRLAVVTGIPGHGKSEVVDQIVLLLNMVHGWKVGYFSPENHPTSYHFGKIASKITGKSFDHKFTQFAEFQMVYTYINDNFFFIAPEDDLTIESILDKAKYLVRKSGIKVLVIDPYNKLEHMTKAGESETQYISRFLDRLTNFARLNGVLVFLVAHPRKMQARKDMPGSFEVPTLYDINGSANFYNKTDYGLTIFRDWGAETVSVVVQKVKFKHWGKTGSVEFGYNAVNGRLMLKDKEPTYESWLGPKETPMQIDFPNNEEAPF